MKMLWRLSREAVRYRGLYIIAILATLGLTAVNLTAPRALSAMTGIVERGVDEEGLRSIGMLTGALVGLVDGDIVIEEAAGTQRRFPQKAVAVVRPLIEFDEEDLEDDAPSGDALKA